MKKPNAPIPQGGIVLGGGDQPRVADSILVQQDLVEERVIDENGHARCFVSSAGEWGKVSKYRDVLGFTVLASKDEEGNQWAPLVGARVVLRVKTDNPPEGFVLMDCATRGDGAIIDIAHKLMPVPTPVGQTIHLIMDPNTFFRVEVSAPGLGYAGVKLRVTMHTKCAVEPPKS